MASASAGKFSQQEERKVEKDAFRNEPIEIVGMKNRKGKFKLSQKITDDDEWLENFSVTVVNRSGKTITGVVIDIIFHRPENDGKSNDPPYVYTLHFSANPFFPEYELRDRSKVIKPGEAVDITVSEEDYRQNKEFLRQAEYTAGIKRVQLVIKAVGYEDGTIWSGGTTFRRDPNNPNRILEEEEKSGREQQLPAGFLAAGLYEPARPYIVNAAWIEPAPAQMLGACGKKGLSRRMWCDATYPPGESLTCSKDYDTLNTNSTDKSSQLYNGLAGCLKWDTTRNLYVSCGAIEPAEKSVDSISARGVKTFLRLP